MTKKKNLGESAEQSADAAEAPESRKPAIQTYTIPLNRPVQLKHEGGDTINELQVIEPYGYMMRGFGLGDIVNANDEAFAKLFPKITKNVPVDYQLIKEIDIDIFADLQAGLMNMLSDIIGTGELVKEHNGALILTLPHALEVDGQTITELHFPRRVQTSVVRGHGMQALRVRDIECLCDAAARTCTNADLSANDYKNMKLGNLLGLGDIVAYWLNEKETDADFL
ncbi:MAG: hypothetical protein ACK5LJ_11235 [Paracoccus sp. (in: a-proteobacteria)]